MKIIAACLIKEDAEGNSIYEKRLFGSMTRDLHELAQWLCAARVTAVAMEATGVYWMQCGMYWNHTDCSCYSSTRSITKRCGGRRPISKTEMRIADLLRDGRLEGSYVPPVAIRVLRDLTRYRTKLVQYQSSIANRIQKLLEQLWPALKVGAGEENRLSTKVWRTPMPGIVRTSYVPIKHCFLARFPL